MIFASPTIYIEDYSDEPEPDDEDMIVEEQPLEKLMLSARPELNGEREGFQMRQSKRRSLTNIYGKNIYQNLKSKRKGS